MGGKAGAAPKAPWAGGACEASEAPGASSFAFCASTPTLSPRRRRPAPPAPRFLPSLPSPSRSPPPPPARSVAHPCWASPEVPPPRGGRAGQRSSATDRWFSVNQNGLDSPAYKLLYELLTPRVDAGNKDAHVRLQPRAKALTARARFLIVQDGAQCAHTFARSGLLERGRPPHLALRGKPPEV